MHNVAPVTFSGGGDEPSQKWPHERKTRKWALLWRSMVLSSLAKTLFPYCRYIKELDLRDLEYLFDDMKFKGAIEKLELKSSKKGHYLTNVTLGNFSLGIFPNSIESQILLGSPMSKEEPQKDYTLHL